MFSRGAIIRTIDRSERPPAIDLLSLAAICLLLSSIGIGGFGFYSDDWQLLYDLERMRSAGQIDLARLFVDFGPRPLHGLYLAAEYLVFGYAPLGYYVVNALVLGASICLLYLLLREIGLGRSIAFAASAVTAVLPQLSTVRIWISASQIPLAMLLATAAMLCQLRFHRKRRAGWLVAATVAALLSVAAYEIFAPFIVLTGFVLAGMDGRGNSTRTARLADVVPVLALVLAGLAKGTVSNRLQTRPASYLAEAHTFFRPDYDWRTDYGLNLFAALDVHFVETIGAWVREANQILTGNVVIPVLLAAATAGVLAFWRASASDESAGTKLPYVFALGVIAWVAGHGVFLFTGDIMFSPSGIANRVLVAAAVGAALMLVALTAWLLRALPAGHRALPFGLAIATIVFLGFSRAARSADHWMEATQKQNHVLALARADLSEVPAGSTVILDGLCPYDGPAIVFEAYWDSAGALSHLLARPVRADVVSPRMLMGKLGLVTSIYGYRSVYPFGTSLYVYDVRSRSLKLLPDAASAREYFQRSGREPLRCPEGYVGQGILI